MAWYGRLCVLLFLVHVSLVCCDCDEETDFFEDGSLEGFDIQQLYTKKCEFKCKKGKQQSPNKKYKHKAKTCGKLGMEYSFLVGIADVTSCCDQLYMCYETCGKQKVECDTSFSVCLQQMCEDNFVSDEDDVCPETALVMFTTVLALGCDAYLVGQKNGCPCKRITEPRITKEEPRLTKEEPHITKEEPHITKEEPRITKEEPHITKEEPRITKEKEEPRITKEEL